MKNFKALTFLLLALSSLTSCQEDDPTGAEGALGKQFKTAVDNVTSSLAYSIIASSDGSKVFVTTTPTGGYYYSADGGATFNTADNYYLRYATSIDNLGNVLTTDGYVINGSSVNNFNGYGQLILGDDGKIFRYNDVIQYREISSGEFTTIEKPAEPEMGMGIYVMKAPGKGLLYLHASVTAAKAWFLDEGTLTWSSPVSVTFNSTPLNQGCNNLNAFVKFAYAGNNILLVKGCTGVALIDLSNSNSTPIMYPSSENEHLIYEDLRDGQVFVDKKKQVYVVASTYEDPSRTKIIYRYDGSQWAKLENQFTLNQASVFYADNSGNIYYNASDGAGESIRGTIKLDVSSNNRTALKLPTENLTITDAAAIDDNTVFMTVGNALYKHDISSNKTTSTSLKNVSHINLLSDGRLIAGGTDKVFISSDDGESWTEINNVFSSVDPAMSMASPSQSRVVNGKLIIIGTYHYYYNNQTLGILQDKYDNIAVQLDGTTSTKLPYTFPSDFNPATIATDGAIYGSVMFLFEYQYSSIGYELKPNMAPSELTGFGSAPQVVTESGLQLSVLGAQAGGLEIKKRKSIGDQWESTNTPLPSTISSGMVTFKLSGERFVVINYSRVYISAD